MANLYPALDNIHRLKVPATSGEIHLINFLKDNLDDSYEVFFNPYLDGDRPDLIILKIQCAAYIVEVKDWNLNHYNISDKNKWEVSKDSTVSSIASPQSQTFRYKKNLYDLHLPVLGLANLENPSFFNVVHCFVYFHNADINNINRIYHSAERRVSKILGDNNDNFFQKVIEHKKYEDTRKYFDRIKNNMQRDKFISFGNDELKKLVKKIKEKSKQKHPLFNDDVYNDFKRRLTPPEHTLQQGIPINFDKIQLPKTVSKNGKEKIKGVAGCGKTSILAQRAINAHSRHEEETLILTFNITLTNYIKDKISDIQGSRNFKCIEISNYHQFFTSQANNVGIDIQELIEKYGFNTLYSTDIFNNKNTIKYSSIFLDEIQDYDPKWVKIIRDNFLNPNGEMVLFGDESQNIYNMDTSRAPVIAQGFGRWNKLTRSYRTDLESPLNQIFNAFQKEYLIEKYTDSEIFDVAQTQGQINFNLLKYEPISLNNQCEDIFNSINSYIKMYDLQPNDVVILSSKINIIRDVNEYWTEKTQCMFETYKELSSCSLRRHNPQRISIEELKNYNDKQLNKYIKENKECVDNIRRTKKSHFYGNSGLIKLSTIHSYKGLESKTVFYILNEDDKPEIIYTSITRATENLIIFDCSNNNQTSRFFKNIFLNYNY